MLQINRVQMVNLPYELTNLTIIFSTCDGQQVCDGSTQRFLTYPASHSIHTGVIPNDSIVYHITIMSPMKCWCR